MIVVALLSAHARGQTAHAMRGMVLQVDAARNSVVVVPVVEELLFRVLLQGWLESWWSARRAKRATPTERSNRT